MQVWDVGVEKNECVCVYVFAVESMLYKFLSVQNLNLRGVQDKDKQFTENFVYEFSVVVEI